MLYPWVKVIDFPNNKGPSLEGGYNVDQISHRSLAKKY